MKIMKIILEILCANISLLNGENTKTENYHDGNIEHNKYWCLSFPLFSFKKYINIDSTTVYQIYVVCVTFILCLFPNQHNFSTLEKKNLNSQFT